MPYKDDPTSRKRRDPDETLRANQEIIRRHLRDESVRAIAAAVGVPRMSVQRTIQQYKRARAQRDDDLRDDGERDAELGALLSKYEGGVSGDFSIGNADPVLVARLVANGVDVEHPDTLMLLERVTVDPADELARFRLSYAPRTAAWWAGRNKLGQPLAEAAELKAKFEAGWRYRDFAWHPPATEPTSSGWADRDCDW
jgi:hypothetical protein